MKTKWITLFVPVVFLLLLFSSCSIIKTQKTKAKNPINTINNFSHKIVNNGDYGIFWQGYVNYEGDTLFFRFVGKVRYRVQKENNKDILYFKEKNSPPLIITREVKDKFNRPVIKKRKGKEMTKWSFIGQKDNLLIVEKLLKKGNINYYYVPKNRDSAINKMKRLYGVSHKKANKILTRMEKP